MALSLLDLRYRRINILVAVPLFGQDVAPRFGFANKFFLAELVDRQIVNEDLKVVSTNSWAGRLGELRDLNVEIIVCGGFNRMFVPLAESLGIRVVAGLHGNAREAVELFARDDGIATSFCRGKKRQGKCEFRGFRGSKKIGPGRHGKRTHQ